MHEIVIVTKTHLSIHSKIDQSPKNRPQAKTNKVDRYFHSIPVICQIIAFSAPSLKCSDKVQI